MINLIKKFNKIYFIISYTLKYIKLIIFYPCTSIVSIIFRTPPCLNFVCQSSNHTFFTITLECTHWHVCISSHKVWNHTLQPNCIIEDTSKIMFNGNIKFIQHIMEVHQGPSSVWVVYNTIGIKYQSQIIW